MFGFLLVGILGIWTLIIGLIEGYIGAVLAGGFITLVMGRIIYIQKISKANTEKSGEVDK